MIPSGAVFADVPEEILRAVCSWLFFEEVRPRWMSMQEMMPQFSVSSVEIHDSKRNPFPISMVRDMQLMTMVTDKESTGWRSGTVYRFEAVRPTGVLVEQLNVTPKWSPARVVPNTRFVSYETDGKAAIIFSTTLGDGRFAFLKTCEVSGGERKTSFGLMDGTSGGTETEFKGLMYKNCPFCASREIMCVCPSELTRRHFQGEMLHRREKNRQSHQLMGAWRSQYLQEWMTGLWTYRINSDSILSFRVDPIVSTAGNPCLNLMTSLLQTQQEMILNPSSGLTSLEDSKFANSTSGSGKAQVTSPLENESSMSLKKNEENKYSCPMCETTSKRKYDIEVHILCVHKGKRRFQCSMCPRAFLRRNHLNDHVRGAHEACAENTCATCGKPFGAPSKLKRHVLTVHENVRNHRCVHCGKAYKHKTAMMNHELKEH